jgi:putative endonuclease
MWFVYILQHTLTKQFYYGFTNDLENRVNKHNTGKVKSTLRKEGEWVLIYYEAYRSKEDAILRERRIKNHGRAIQELKKRFSKSLIN